ncbi:flavodoxin family protein [Neorhizobium sp. P12A]|uniref:NAD(P)H-dependent oxidoreductase n=1 Tax=Neorhizobium sp. P12A TaxID=2268027 RepID=UPI0011ED6546|nr:NAD(P)H-dependent oxidoreductase [Neorhizobium sp. P12A]KAA0693328.1 flavodoxin family protein [Neorhizobium sp. P12A]
MSHNTLIIAAHPDIANSTVHAAWLRAVRNAGVADVHDIVATYPDGVIDVPKEQKLIEAHARIILQFPIFWYSVPVVLKSWIDEVLSHGRAYGPGGEVFIGKELGLAYSTGTVACLQGGRAQSFLNARTDKAARSDRIVYQGPFLAELHPAWCQCRLQQSGTGREHESLPRLSGN